MDHYIKFEKQGKSLQFKISSSCVILFKIFDVLVKWIFILIKILDESLFIILDVLSCPLSIIVIILLVAIKLIRNRPKKTIPICIYIPYEKPNLFQRPSKLFKMSFEIQTTLLIEVKISTLLLSHFLYFLFSFLLIPSFLLSSLSSCLLLSLLLA